jgi:hypothetical protein
MSHKTLGRVITLSFVACSAVCLLGALLLAIASPGEESLALVTTCSLSLSATTWLATWK